MSQLRIHEVFQEQVKLRPDRPALEFQGTIKTYAQVDEEANQVAHALMARGVQPGTLVGVFMHRSPEMIIGLLGILKAGAAYLPLDPAYPAERLTYMITDAQVSTLLTGTQTEAFLPDAYQGEALCMDETDAFYRGEPVHTPEVIGSLEDLAYVNYTSGSTGRPKGVMIPHRGVIRLVKHSTFWPFSDKEVFLHMASISFDSATLEIWGSLLNGARLVLLPLHFTSLQELGRIIKQSNVTTLQMTTGLFHQMVEDHVEDLKPLRYMSVGGDVLSALHAKKVLEAVPGLVLVNGYGPTENTTFTTTYVMTDPSQCGTKVPIGKPINQTEVFILDENLHLVPDGEIGELFTGGMGVALGYLNRQELTAERFVENRWGSGSGRLYRTGDLVRRLPDGNLEFCGRADSQVKVRGFRIELGEIESSLLEHPGVKSAVVVAKEWGNVEKQLFAYLIPNQDAELDMQDVRSYLKNSLPAFMIPARFFQIEKFPLNQNGKVDREKLPFPNQEQGRGIGTTGTEMERVLAEMWKEVLHLEAVGVDEPFFVLGGDSLTATRIITRVLGKLGVEIPIQTFFTSGTISELAKWIEQQRETSPKEQKDLVLTISRLEKQTMSLPQEQMLIMQQMSQNKATYNVFVGVRLTGELDLEALRSSFTALVQRHDLLRAVVVNGENGQTFQRVKPEADFEWNVYHQAEERLVQAEAARPFDLWQGPMLRVTVFQRSDAEADVLVVLPHFVTDGWSMGVLSHEISELYASLKQLRPANLPPLQHQYADFAVWQRQRMQTYEWQQQVQYWKKQLQGAPQLLELPTDFPRLSVQSHHGRVAHLPLDGELTAKIKERAKQHNVTVYMVLLAAFQALLFRYTQQEDFLVGTHLASRNRLEWEFQIGYFVNTVLMRANLQGDPSFSQLLQSVKRTTLGAVENQEVRFETLVQELRPERNLSYNPVFQVAFVLQNNETNQWNLPGVHVQALFVDNGTSKFDLSLLVEEQEEGLVGRFEYDTNLFREDTIRRLALHWKQLLTGFLADPDRPISVVSMLTDEEKSQLEVWTPISNLEAPEQNLIQLFEAQVVRTPDLPALTFGADTLTYAQLDERANQLAVHLLARVPEQNALFGIFMERSLEMVISILAVLKAGSAYVPLDPGYPQERITYMLEDAQISVLLTTKSVSSSVSTWRGEVLEVAALLRNGTCEIPDPVKHRKAKPDDPAYVIYTSGSTGKPKGVVIPQRAICNHMVWMQKQFPLQPGDRVLQKTPFSFDASVWEFFAPLLAGAELVMATPGLQTDPQGMIAAIQRLSITTLQLVPTLLQLLLEEVDFAACTSLRRVFCGGEVLTRAATEAFFSTFQRTDLINLYGPTETCIDAAFWVCERVQSQSSVPIGRAIEGIELYVMDKQGHPLPVGIPGELWIGGAGVAIGYLHRPDLTTEKFVQHPLFADTARRLYKTGDLVKRLPTGELEYVNRIDQQVKLRGFRIELGEIENVLRTHPAVGQALVAVQHICEEPTLFAYIIPVPSFNVTNQDFRSYLKLHLPAHMVPQQYLFLEEFPVTPSGKIDKKALPFPEREVLVAPVRPLTPTEQEIADIFQEVFGVPVVGPYDHFFDMGGHSLLAIRIVSRLKDRFHKEVTLQLLFQKPTVEELAEALDGMKQQGPVQETASRDLKDVLLDVDDMTDEEVEAMLSMLLE